MSRDCCLQVGTAVVATVFVLALSTALVASIVAHFTCNWWSKSEWVAWDEQCTASRVSFVACLVLIAEIVFLVVVGIFAAITRVLCIGNGHYEIV